MPGFAQVQKKRLMVVQPVNTKLITAINNPGLINTRLFVLLKIYPFNIVIILQIIFLVFCAKSPEMRK